MLIIQSDQCNDIKYFVVEWCDRHVKSNAIFFSIKKAFYKLVNKNFMYHKRDVYIYVKLYCFDINKPSIDNFDSADFYFI